MINKVIGMIYDNFGRKFYEYEDPFPDAPSDEKNYVRKNGDWVEAVLGGDFSGDLDDIDTGTTNVHLTSTLKTNYDAAYDHSQVAHAPSSGILIFTYNL